MAELFTEPGPRLFALPPGVDFAAEVAAGLLARLGSAPPESLARVTIHVNTRRMQRHLRDAFATGPARLLPRITLITDLALDPAGGDLPPAIPALRRRLELSRLVAGLLDREPDLADRAALFDLSDSLARLLDEMHGEGVPPDAFARLDVSDLSGHWARALGFLRIAADFAQGDAPDREARQRAVIERLAARWETHPPADPVLVAGSTGSRGATALFLRAVARLPQGAVILPGVDTDLPGPVWDNLDSALTAEDHPQYRFKRLAEALSLAPATIPRWTDTPPARPACNRLISLSLRPAPVTDQWRIDGPALGDLMAATEGLTLVEASSPRAEAEAIALRLRAAVEEGITAVLFTPDRMLTRQVAAALDRWSIVPDDSGGQPLDLSPPGRFLRQVADLMGRKATAGPLLALLKHPLCNSGPGRGDHLRHAHDLELWVRHKGLPFPTAADLRAWGDQGDRAPWAAWVATALDALAAVGGAPLAALVPRHLALAESLAAGPSGPAAGALWAEAAGRSARAMTADLARHAEAAGHLSPRDYAALFAAVIAGGEVRDRDTGHPRILIRGTLEARVDSADLVILGGLNEGTWPGTPKPDPWLNRALRHQAGLLLPERQIGLSAHDYMQAIAAPQVWLTRPIRSDDAQTVASRWLLRLMNLLAGLPDQGGEGALAAMRGRGADWLARAATLSEPAGPVPRAPRPSPRPPPEARPKQLSVTAVTDLLRDPYAIYARHVLRLRPLDPLTPAADAPWRGQVIHRIFQRFIDTGPPPDDPTARAALMTATDAVLAADCPWPTVRALWRARIDRVADWFLETDASRRALATPRLIEEPGSLPAPGRAFTLTGKADRIDLTPDGRAMIYDYKTGTPPTEKQQRAFDKQLLLEAAMVERGAFSALGPRTVAGAAYIGLGAKPAIVTAPLADQPPAQIWDEFLQLLDRWSRRDRGYTSRLAPRQTTDAGKYDHLARFGEWDHTTDPTPGDVG
jgi:ATP-dependent helicase/nuclease subunit B